MMGGASEVLFLAAKDFIKGRVGRNARKLPDISSPIQARVPFLTDGVAAIAPNACGLGSEQA